MPRDGRRPRRQGLFGDHLDKGGEESEGDGPEPAHEGHVPAGEVIRAGRAQEREEREGRAAHHEGEGEVEGPCHERLLGRSGALKGSCRDAGDRPDLFWGVRQRSMTDDNTVNKPLICSASRNVCAEIEKPARWTCAAATQPGPAPDC